MTEIRLLLTAVQYFTRIRVPAWVGHAPERLTGAVRYFPLVGLIVGASAAAVMWLASLRLPAPLLRRPRRRCGASPVRSAWISRR